MTPEEFLKFNSWERVLEDLRAADDAVARCENIYMKWLMARHAPAFKIVREAA